MRLRSFTAPTMREAMTLVRETMGLDAIIVSTHENGPGAGVQIMAAREEDDTFAEPARAPDSEVRPRRASTVADTLSYHGVPAQLATRLDVAAAETGTQDPTIALTGAIERQIEFDTLSLSPERALMLVGPSGAGKSATAAKLAARRALAGESTGLVTTDTQRAGAVAQLEAYAEILKAPLATAGDPNAFCRTLRTADRTTPIIVDTPGTNPFDDEELRELGRFIAADEVEPVLVLAAGGDAEEAADIARAFARLGCRRMIITRVDAARRLGATLAAAAAGELLLTEVGVSASIAQGLLPIDAPALARLLCRDPEQHAGGTSPKERKP